MSLPQPDDLTSLVLRVDFSDDAAWQTLQEAIDGASGRRMATYVSDPAYAGHTVQDLAGAERAAGEREKVLYLFLADQEAISGPDHAVLAVDLHDEPGRVFRVPARWFADVSANLSIANLDFEEFADAVDASGAYRGFGDE